MLNETAKRTALSSQDYIDLEDVYGTHHYKPLDVVLDKGDGVWVYDVEGQQVPRLPVRLFGRQPGTLPPADHAAMQEQMQHSYAGIAGVLQRSDGPFPETAL